MTFIKRLAIAVLAVTAVGAAPILAQEVTGARISVNDPRPVVAALKSFEAKYGWAVSYEDPRYAYPGDLVDVTNPQWRQANPNDPRRALVPRGGSLAFDVVEIRATGKPDNPDQVLQHLLDVSQGLGYPGQFRVLRIAEVTAVIPTHVRDAQGRMVEHGSPFDLPISLPKRQRDGLTLVKEVLGELRKGGVTVGLGGVSWNYLYYTATNIEATNEPVRNVLARAFGSGAPGNDGASWQPVWRLLFDPAAQMYFLNFHGIRKQVPPAEAPTAPTLNDGRNGQFLRKKQ